VPIPFELRYEPTRIDPKHQYTVSARILVDGQLRFISDTAYPVLGSGAPATDVEIVVKPVPTKP
jgi:putative lipoprotein